MSASSSLVNGFWLVAVLTAAVSPGGCADPGSDVGDEVSDPSLEAPESAGDLADTRVYAPTFKNVLAKVLSSCGGGGACHQRFPFGAGLDLRDENAYASLVNVTAQLAPSKLRVAPGDVAQSFLYQKLHNWQGPDEGQAMPKNEFGPWQSLSKAKLSLVRRWILAGAPND